MDVTQTAVNHHTEILDAFFDRLQRIFAAMDREYRLATEHYEFQCNGCEDNCCRSRFYHHTHLEYQYLLTGIGKLAPQKQREIQSRAREICRKTVDAQRAGMPVQLWCPLNFSGKCALYSYRPMICRLHGIPYQLQKPRQPIIYGPGCGAFNDRCADKSYCIFDRTPFYFKMAKLESEFKQATGLTGRIKMTIAEISANTGPRSGKRSDMQS